MQALPVGGAMLAVRAAERQVIEQMHPFGDALSIAAINGPSAVVISGDTPAIEAIADAFGEQGVVSRRLIVSHAFHSRRMDPMLKGFRGAIAGLEMHPPTIPIVSALLGARAGAEVATVDHWVEHVRGPVRFADTMSALDGEGARTFVEIGPRPILAGMAAGALTGPPPFVVPSLSGRVPDEESVLEALGSVFCRGLAVDWAGVFPDGGRRHELPQTRWQRRRYWVEPGPRIAEAENLEPAEAELEPDRESLADRLASASDGERLPLITEFLQREIRAVTRSETPLGPETALRDLGMDSLMGLELRTRIDAELGVALPLSLVWQDLDVRALARVVVQGRGTPSAPTTGVLVPLSTRGGASPLFCLHPIHGSVHGFQALADALDRPVYGLRALGMEPTEQPLDDLDAMATAYLKVCRGVQPTGPLHLLGYSFGASVAHAMAQRDSVGALVLVDGRPAGSPAPALAAEQLVANALGLQASKPNAAAIIAHARAHHRYPDREVAGQIERMLALVRAHLIAFSRAEPTHLNHAAALIRTESGPPGASQTDDLGWEGRVADLTVHRVSGEHSDVLEQPDLVRAVQQCLEGFG